MLTYIRLDMLLDYVPKQYVRNKYQPVLCAEGYAPTTWIRLGARTAVHSSAWVERYSTGENVAPRETCDWRVRM